MASDGWGGSWIYEGSYKLALPPAGYPDTRISERHRSGLYRCTAIRWLAVARKVDSRDGCSRAKAGRGQGGFITGALAVIIFLQDGDETRAPVTRVTDLSRAREDRARAHALRLVLASARTIMTSIFHNLFCCRIYGNLLAGLARYLLSFRLLYARACTLPRSESLAIFQ